MNERQQELLDFILHYFSEHGYSPSLRDIIDGTSFTSTSVVAYNLDRLEAMGHVKRDKGISRSIRVLKRFHDPAVHGKDGRYQYYLDRWRARFGDEDEASYD